MNKFNLILLSVLVLSGCNKTQQHIVNVGVTVAETDTQETSPAQVGGFISLNIVPFEDEAGEDEQVCHSFQGYGIIYVDKFGGNSLIMPVSNYDTPLHNDYMLTATIADDGVIIESVLTYGEYNEYNVATLSGNINASGEVSYVGRGNHDCKGVFIFF